MGLKEEIWWDLCQVTDIPVRGSRIVKSPKGCVALFRTIDENVYALKDQCPHKNGPLSQGIVHDNSVTCPLHNWVISLETGSVLGADEGSVETFDVRVVDGRVHLRAF